MPKDHMSTQAKMALPMMVDGSRQMNDTGDDYLRKTYEILKCAFPDGVSESEYWPLVAVLHASMSFRTLARVLSVMANKHYIEVFNDASGFGLDPLPTPEEVENVRQKLMLCGYEDWFEEF